MKIIVWEKMGHSKQKLELIILLLKYNYKYTDDKRHLK